LRLLHLFLASAVLTGCGASSPSSAPAPAGASSGINPEWRLAGKSRVAEGAQAMVVSGSPIASEVGRDILRAGGNAVDAAVAVGFALAVVHPEAGNLGGGGFMVFRMADRHRGRRVGLPRGGARTRVHDMYLDRRASHRALGQGHLAAGVRAPVAGLVEAHHKFGRLPFAAMIEPAIKLASQGFTVDEHRSRSIDNYRAWLYTFPASRRYFLPDSGRAPAPGSVLVQADLGRTLTAIRDQGADGFYKGWVADSIVAEMDRGGGLISLADLAAYHAVWREPIKIDYRGYTIYSMPPASSGGVTLALILNIMEGTARCLPSAQPRCCTVKRRRCDGLSPSAISTSAIRGS
jgi:gamma-glutamyltranspeptidase/glutathione hydrolase